jgi:acetyl-CoA carboxylase alpha subunit
VAGAGVAGAGGLGGAAAIEFTDFVNDLIMNKTSSTTRPETIDDKTFKDSMSPTAFDPLFQ